MSWVSTGPNEPIEKGQLEQALGPELLGRLTRQTGLSRDELLRRLSRILLEAVNQLTPEGHIPHQQENGQRMLDSSSFPSVI